MEFGRLFTPITINNVTIGNRIVDACDGAFFTLKIIRSTTVSRLFIEKEILEESDL
jgi:hypothetical protein